MAESSRAKIDFEEMDIYDKLLRKMGNSKSKNSAFYDMFRSQSQIRNSLHRDPEETKQRSKEQIEKTVLDYLTTKKLLGATASNPLSNRDSGMMNIVIEKLKRDKELSEKEEKFMASAMESMKSAYDQLAASEKEFNVSLKEILSQYVTTVKDDKASFQVKLKALQESQKILSTYVKKTGKILDKDSLQLTGIDLSKATPQDLEKLGTLLATAQEKAAKKLFKVRANDLPGGVPDDYDVERTLGLHGKLKRKTFSSTMKSHFKESTKGIGMQVTQELAHTVLSGLGLGGIDKVINISGAAAKGYRYAKGRIGEAIKSRQAMQAYRKEPFDNAGAQQEKWEPIVAPGQVPISGKTKTSPGGGSSPPQGHGLVDTAKDIAIDYVATKYGLKYAGKGLQLATKIPGIGKYISKIPGVGAVVGAGAVETAAKSAATGASSVFSTTKGGGIPGGVFGEPVIETAGKGAKTATGFMGRVGSTLKTGAKVLGGKIPYIGGVVSAGVTALSGGSLSESIGAGVGTVVGGAIGGGLSFGNPLAIVAGGIAGEIVGKKLGKVIGEMEDVFEKSYDVWEKLAKLLQWLMEGGGPSKEGGSGGEKKGVPQPSEEGSSKPTTSKPTKTSSDEPGFVEKAVKWLGSGYGPNDAEASDKVPTPAEGSKSRIFDQVQSSGPGYNVVKTPEGDIVKQEGSRNLRNNNRGNLVYSPFSVKQGAIGKDDKGFAIFRTQEEGDAAAQKLLFEGKRYKGKNLTDAIDIYANSSPASEREAYKKKLLSVVPDKKTDEYTPEEQKAIMKTIHKVEGDKAVKSTVLKKGPGTAPFDTAKTTPTGVEPLDYTPTLYPPNSVQPAVAGKATPFNTNPVTPNSGPSPLFRENTNLGQLVTQSQTAVAQPIIIPQPSGTAEPMQKDEKKLPTISKIDDLSLLLMDQFLRV